MREIVFETMSGARYWIKGSMLKRLNPNDEKRGDGEWLRLLEEPEIVVGMPAYLVLEPLSKYGPDDYGVHGEAMVTNRVTTPVIGIEVRDA